MPCEVGYTSRRSIHMNRCWLRVTIPHDIFFSLISPTSRMYFALQHLRSNILYNFVDWVWMLLHQPCGKKIVGVREFSKFLQSKANTWLSSLSIFFSLPLSGCLCSSAPTWICRHRKKTKSQVRWLRVLYEPSSDFAVFMER